MNPNEARECIEAILAMPTSDVAATYAQTRYDSLLDPVYSQVLLQMTREENVRSGLSRRHQALIRLNEYTAAIVRNRLLETFPGQGVAEALPELLVLTSASPPDKDTNDSWDAEEERTRRMREARERWWDAMTRHFEQKAVIESPGDAPLDDIARANLLRSIDNRLLLVSMRLSRDGRASEDNVRELEAVIQDCDRLLHAEPSKYGFAPPETVRNKRADAQKYLARVYDLLGDTEHALRTYEAAAEALRAAGKPEEASRCSVDSVIMLYNHADHHGRMEAIARMRDILKVIPDDDVEYANTLVELGGMYSGVGEDYEADRILDKAEEKLHAMGHTNPSGTQLADSLKASLCAILTDSVAAGTPASKMPIAVQNQVRSIYRRLYEMRQQIYRGWGDLDRAERYRLLLEQQAQREQMDGTIAEGNKLNQEFSERMLQSVQSLMELLDKPPKGE
jgi:tetratricopeptide (TPR) repeat protein